jgi:hypothetical protein
MPTGESPFLHFKALTSFLQIERVHQNGVASIACSSLEAKIAG